MPRKAKQVDLEEAIAAKNGAAESGHNSKLTDDERRALTLHHKRAYEAADAVVEQAKAERKAISDRAKSELGKGALADIKDLISWGDEKKLKGSIERALRLGRWLGLPIGTQMHLFNAPAEDSAFEIGKVAGMGGEICDPPRHLAAPSYQDWTRGWHEGQGILASAFAKVKPVEPPITAATSQPEAVAIQ